MFRMLTKDDLAYYERTRELERLCVRQQATIERQAALLKEERSGARSVNAEIRRLQARIRELEEQLGRTSINSSQPPSADGPEVVRPKRRGKRRRGGRREHTGRSRPLLPIEQIDAVVDCKPDCCCGCQNPLSGDDPQPWRHLVSDIPEPRIEVTKYRRHRLKCTSCGYVTIGELPKGVSQGSFGPRLHAMIALLTGRFQLSKRDVEVPYGIFFDLDLCASSVIAMERRMAEALADPVRDAIDWVRSRPVVHPDETGWRQAKERAWLWTAATEEVVVFNVHRRRNQEAAKVLLGEDFSGVVCTDRYGAYNWIERRRIHRLLVAAAARAPAEKTQRECAELLKHEGRLWIFMQVDAMPPTNNLAERCLRRAVIWRKKCFGTDSEAGSRFVAHILSVVTTLTLQNRPIFDFLVQAREAAVHDVKPPSLCPTT